MPPELEECRVPKMILQPLAENAILHGLDGVEDGVIWVRVRSQGTQTLTISVEDNGRGLPPELMGPYTGPPETSGRGHLGLYNVDTILKKHYGEAYASASAPGPRTGSGGDRLAAPVEGGRDMLKVLVVEDEEMIRKGIVLAVDWAALDCVVVGEAADGLQALKAVERYDPSLIITDLKMPNMDGIQMMEALRARGSRAYVIILTAYDSFTYARSALRLGAVDFLLKPFHDGELEAAVIKLRRRMEAEGSGTAPALPERKKGDKSKYVLQAMDYIGQHYGDQNISVGEIAQYLGLSESHLSHLFRKETDYTLLNYLTRYRIHKAMELLRDCRTKVYEVAERVGYRDITYFSATFKKVTGMSPSEFQDTCR